MSDWFKTLDRSHSDSIKWILAKNNCQSKECLTFDIADSDYETAPSIKQALLERVEHGAFGYTYKGDNYEEIIQTWNLKRYHSQIEKDKIIAIPSVLNGLAMILQELTNPMDRVIIQSPVYHMFKMVIEENNRIMVDNPLIEGDTYQINFKHLEDLYKKGINTLVFCHPHNPVGRVWTKQELDDLVDLSKKYDVTIISDEIHADIIMPGNEMVSLSSYMDNYEKIIVLQAPTKVFNIAGIKIATMILKSNDFFSKLEKAYAKLHLSSPNLFALTAIKAAYQNSDKWLIAQNKHIHDNFVLLKSALQDFDFVKVYPLEGTYLAWVKLTSKHLNISELLEKLQLQGVFISEGSKFGHGDSFIRLSLACSKEQLLKGLDIIITQIKKAM